MTQGKGQPLKDFSQLSQALPGQPGRPSSVPHQTQGSIASAGGHAGGLPAQYTQTLRGGYFDQSGYIREDFVVSYAKEIADKLEVGENEGKIKMTRSLLRNFYAEVMDIKHLLRGGRPFEALRPRILKLEAFATNAANRRTNRAPQMFRSFITENGRIASKDSHSFLDGFCQHFECIVLYFRGR